MSDLSKPEKHATIKGVALADLRALLIRREKKRARLLLPEAMDFFGCPAPRADTLLRKIAKAGYIRWTKGEIDGEDWSITDFGLRLIMDELADPIDRTEATRIIETVLARVRQINADPGRLARIPEVRLYGSALETGREHFGDVDIELAPTCRSEPDPDVERVSALLAPQVPQSYRRHTPDAKASVALWDARRALAEIRQGLKALSVTSDSTRQTGCRYQVIYRFDLASSSEIPGDADITPGRSAAPTPACKVTIPPIPRQTVVAPKRQPGSDDLVPARRQTVNARDLSYNEAIAWLGERTGAAGAAEPCDLKLRSELAFSGARDLFPDWRDTSLSGLQLFDRALAWAEAHDLPIAREPRKLKLQTASRSRVARFNDLQVERVLDTIDADLAFNLVSKTGRLIRGSQAGHISPRMIAAHHALAVAMGRMIDETGLSGRGRFSAEFDLSTVRSRSWPALPKLSGRARKLQKLLTAVEVPQRTLASARSGTTPHAQDVMVRQVDVCASLRQGSSARSPQCSSRLRFDLLPAREDDICLFEIENREAGREGRKRLAWPGEDSLLSGANVMADELGKLIKTLPGCVSLKLGRQISEEAP